MRILVLNGPNINLLGSRDKSVYGSSTYAELLALLKDYAKNHKLEIDEVQSNHEGVLIDTLQESAKSYDGIIFNPAAFTHTSIALYDTLMAIEIPCVEVHVSDVDNREDFRRVNYIRGACVASVSNLGIKGYIKAIELLRGKIEW